MKHPSAILVAAALLVLAGPAAARAAGWIFTPAAEGRGPELSVAYSADTIGRYEFQCANGSLTATQRGATALMDLASGAKVPDAGGGALPAGAALMALVTERSNPDLAPARATANPVRGWDMSITLPLDDPSVKALSRAKGISLMTTGWTTMVMLSSADKSALSAFLKACKAG